MNWASVESDGEWLAFHTTEPDAYAPDGLANRALAHDAVTVPIYLRVARQPFVVGVGCAAAGPPWDRSCGWCRLRKAPGDASSDSDDIPPKLGLRDRVAL